MKPVLTPELERKLIDALSWTYNSIGYDCWGERVPGKAEFVDVLCDQLRTQCGPHGENWLTTAEIDTFHQLSHAKQRALCLRAGP